VPLRSFDYLIIWDAHNENIDRSGASSDGQFAFSSSPDRDFLMVERWSELHPSIMGIHRSRTRDRDGPLAAVAMSIASAAAPTRFTVERPRTCARRERRHSGRVRSTGTAIVYGSCAAHGRIVDVGIRGLSLLLDAGAAPDVGERVRLDVRLDGVGRWLGLTGSVARVDARHFRTALVIELAVVPQDFEDLVQDELLSALECARMPWILLVDGARARRARVAAAFRAIGCHVIEASSPLEAIAEIDQSRRHLWAIVIGDTKPASHADELRRFFAETYPGVSVIDVGERVPTRGTPMINVDRAPVLALQIERLVGMHEHLGGLV
jgi:hypothetical protein